VLLPSFVFGPALQATPQPTTVAAYSGQATVVRATLIPLGTTVVVSDTGPLPPGGGALQKSLLTVNVPNLLTANVAHATTIGQGVHSRSEASVADLNLTVGGQTIKAGFLMANAEAECSAEKGPVAIGSSQLVNLVINGQAITVSGQPNETINLPAGAGSVIINEQSKTVTSNSADITVNALHVIVTGVADVVISSAHADITCASTPTCTGSDFVTGGGFITAPSGAKANFGVAGGIKNGAFWGHLEYNDKGGPKVHGTSVTNYIVVSPTRRHIDGTANVNGQSGFTYHVDVEDNGEPGTNDYFAIRLSNGYVAAGTLRGGNIQIHKPCP
jgi:hypothetical protein